MNARLAAALASFAITAGILAACGTENRPGSAADGTNLVPGACATPSSGCPCTEEGYSVACGTVEQDLGSYVQCSMGNRTCAGGRWQECEGNLVVIKARPALGTLAYQDAGTPCGTIDPCNPNCMAYSDTPDLANVPPGFTTKDGGLTLPGSVSGGTCTSVSISPSPTATVTITDFTPFTTTPATTGFTATFAPAGCVPAGTQPTWTVSRPDLATISNTGQLAVFSGAAGTGIMTVQAFFGALSSNAVSVNVRVRVRADTAADIASNTAAPGGQVDKFWSDAARTIPAVPTSVSNATFLYPYEETFFPLGLPPPVVMFKAAANPGNSVKLVLRYPSGSTNATSSFEYALIVKEQACNDAALCYRYTPDTNPQIDIPVAAWRAFEQTAKGAYGDIVVQRWDASNLQQEKAERIFFVNGQLKGTVLYGTYNTPTNANQGATMQIAPGATSPTIAVREAAGKCVTCHIANEDGSVVYANGWRAPSGGGFQDSRLYDMDPPQVPSTVIRNYDNAGSGTGTPTANPGIRFNYGAMRKNGRLLLTHGGAQDPNFRAHQTASQFWDPFVPTQRTFTGWPTNVNAVTPRFAHDGNKFAFSFWSGTALGAVSPNANGRNLVVMDINCPDAVDCSTGGTVANARIVNPGMPLTTTTAALTATGRSVWPSFTPDGDSVIFQRQITDANLTNTWSPSRINTTTGSQADLWIAKTAGGLAPQRLDLLNGIRAGARYLPTTPRDVNPVLSNFHLENINIPYRVADNCGSTGTAANVSDTRLNYKPSVLPVEAGGYQWVVFTSRRMYGSIAVDNPWDAMPNTTCGSDTPAPKKLWVAAVDKAWAPGTDPSHPAFLLPGQELMSGNADADWVNQKCAPANATCETNADCCAGNTCQINLPVPASGVVTRSCRSAAACQPLAANCTVDADCCGSPAVKCLGTGTKVCATVGSFTPASFTRDFTASCVTGTRVAWRAVNWQAEIPANTSIRFSAQSGASVATLAPATPVSVALATATVAAPAWGASAQTVTQALLAATPSTVSGNLLRMTIRLDTTGTASATLYAWRVLYDCVPTE